MHGNNPRKRHGVPMPNGQEKAEARRVIASAQAEAQRVAKLESALQVAAGRIEAYRRIMFLFIDGMPTKEIRILQSEIERVYKDPATAQTSVFEVDADSDPDAIIYRIPSDETRAAAETVKSIMQHSEEHAAAKAASASQEPTASAPSDALGGFSAEDKADMANGTFEQAAPPASGPDDFGGQDPAPGDKE